MLISENYKNVHSGHDHGISWEQTHLASQSQPSNAFQPATTEQHHFKAHTVGNYVTRYTARIETMFKHDYSASIQI